MAIQWFVCYHGKTSGPLSSSQLKAAAESGKLRPDFLVSNDQVTWVNASEVGGLRLPAATTAPPVTPKSPPPLPPLAFPKRLPGVWIVVGAYSLLTIVVILVIAAKNWPLSEPAASDNQTKAAQIKERNGAALDQPRKVEPAASASQLRAAHANEQDEAAHDQARKVLIGQIVDDVNRQLAVARERLSIDPAGVKQDLTLLLERIAGAKELPIPGAKELPADTLSQLRQSVSALIAQASTREGEIAQPDEWLEKGEYDKAISGYTEVIRVDPQFIAAYLNRGLAWNEKGNSDKSIADFTEAIRLYPQDASAYVLRARTVLARGEFDMAIDDSTEAVRLNPRNAGAFVCRGVAWASKGEHQKAIADCSSAISIDPKLPEAYYNRGLARKAVGDETEAADDFQMAAELNPAYAQKTTEKDDLGHSAWVTCAGFTPDGRRIVTGSRDQTTRLWDAETGKVLHVFDGHTGRINSIAVSRDGKQLLTGGMEGSIILWEIESGRKLSEFQGRTITVPFRPTSVAFSPTGNEILAGGADGTVRLFDLRTREESLPFDWAPSLDGAKAFYSPRGDRVIVEGGLNLIGLFDARGGTQLRGFETGQHTLTDSAVVSPNEKYLLTAHNDGARLWDIETGKELRRFGGDISSATFSPNGTRIVTCGLSGAHIWDSTTSTLLHELEGHLAPVLAASFSPDSKWIVTASCDCTARLWNADTGAPIRVFGRPDVGQEPVASSVPPASGPPTSPASVESSNALGTG
jgi:tetratricopeptide (TPR) repeat protein